MTNYGPLRKKQSAARSGNTSVISNSRTGQSALLCEKPTLFIIASKISLYPQEHYDNGLSIVTVPTRRIAHDALPPTIKSLNYLNNILAKIEARQAGALEAIMLNAQGYVAECTA